MQYNAVRKSDGFALSAISNATKWVKVFRYSFSETVHHKTGKHSQKNLSKGKLVPAGP